MAFTTLSEEEHNMLAVVISIVIILWGYKAIRQFIQTIKIRAALMAGQSVNVRGIGSSLHYFDTVTANHANSVLQTRQSNPPQRIKCLYVPFSLLDCRIGKAGSGIVYISMWSAIPCRIILLESVDCVSVEAAAATYSGENILQYLSRLNCRTGAEKIFKNGSNFDTLRYSAEKQRALGPIGILIIPISDGKTSSSLNSKKSGYIYDDYRQQKQQLQDNATTGPLWSSDSYVEPICSGGASEGYSSIRKDGNKGKLSTFSEQQPSSKGLKAGEDNEFNSLIYEGDRESDEFQIEDISKYSRTVDKEDKSRAPSSAEDRSGDPFGSEQPYSTSSLSSTLIKTQSPSSATMGSLPLDFGIYLFTDVSDLKILFQSSPPQDEQSSQTPLPPKVFRPSKLILGADGVIYSPQEIFGLSENNSVGLKTATAGDADGKEASRGGTSSAKEERGEVVGRHDVVGMLEGFSMVPDSIEDNRSNSSGQSGASGLNGSDENDCVVCLSEEKQVLLLPCRHMCVCRSCFVHIDKCPVCRANFEEYVTVRKDIQESIQIPLFSIDRRNISKAFEREYLPKNLQQEKGASREGKNRESSAAVPVASKKKSTAVSNDSTLNGSAGAGSKGLQANGKVFSSPQKVSNAANSPRQPNASPQFTLPTVPTNLSSSLKEPAFALMDDAEDDSPLIISGRKQSLPKPASGASGAATMNSATNSRIKPPKGKLTDRTETIDTQSDQSLLMESNEELLSSSQLTLQPTPIEPVQSPSSGSAAASNSVSSGAVDGVNFSSDPFSEPFVGRYQDDGDRSGD